MITKVIILCLSLVITVALFTTSYGTARDRAKVRIADAGRLASLTYDIRDSVKGLVPRKAALIGLNRLDRRLSNTVIEFDPLTGSVRSLTRPHGELSGFSQDSPLNIAKKWLSRNFVLLGVDRNDLSSFHLLRSEEFSGGDARITWQQRYKGIAAFDNNLVIYVQKGRISAGSGSPNRNLRVASIKPKLSSIQALSRAINGLPSGLSLGSTPKVRSVLRVPQRITTFNDGSSARLVLFNLGLGKTVLAWKIFYTPSVNQGFEIEIDAHSGRLLKRQSTVAQADANVWDNYPGALIGGAVHPVDLRKWIPDFFHALSNRRLWNNNFWVQALLGPENSTDIKADFIPETGSFPERRPFPGVNCPTVGCSWNSTVPFSWRDNLAQAAIQAFYLLNKFNDHLASSPIGFQNRFTLDNSHRINVFIDVRGNNGIPETVNNASAEADVEGAVITGGEINLPLFQSIEGINIGDVFSAEDAESVFHEYTHLMNWQLNENLFSNEPQADALDEALADWYGLDFLIKEGFIDDTPTPGEVVVGAYYLAGGLRNQPSDCTINAPVNVCPRPVASALFSRGGYNYADFGKIGPEESDSHSNGEVIVQTLLDLRRKLVEELGPKRGANTIEALVTEAIRRLPDNCDFLDIRNSMLAASEDQKIDEIILKVFALRGMGTNAQSGTIEDPETFSFNTFLPIAGYSSTPLGRSGSLDSTFGRNGEVILPYKDNKEQPLLTRANSVATRPDGKIVVAGTSGDSMQIWRFNDDGSLDDSFNQSGIVKKSVTLGGKTLAVTGRSLVIDPDGGILVTGSIEKAFAVWKFNDDGSPDKNFAADGLFSREYKDEKGSFLQARGNGLVLQPDGKIVVTGFVGKALSVWRLNSNGTPDTSFSADGKIERSSSKNTLRGNAVAISLSGQILVTGFVGDAMAVWAYKGGSLEPSKLDESFHGGGEAVFSGKRKSVKRSGNGLYLQPNGKIVIVGNSGNALILWRLTPTGELDRSFDREGSVSFSRSSEKETLQGRSVVVQSDGKIISVGSAGKSLYLRSIFGDGVDDELFGQGGEIELDFTAEKDGSNVQFDARGNSVALQSDGKIVVVGNVGDNLALWRFNNHIVK